MFESADLFERGVGSTTDIVEKETYTFEDRGGDMLTLRAEATAPSAAPTCNTECATSLSP